MTLVEDILFISRADTGQFKLRFAVMSLSELAEQLLKHFLPVAEHAQVHLKVHLPGDLPTIYADELRIQQVLSNLINNAIKFTPPGGTVSLHAVVDGPGLCVEVRDTGEGIPPEDRERIFERFYQAGTHARVQAGGYGLGLAIAKLIVEQHGGRIWVKSRPSVGSSFYFTLPRLDPPSEPDRLGH
jgi:two-component system phosphate regulon sensor histidine kinase PhoR